MIKYQVLYKNTEIGILEINDEGKYRYIPNKDNLSQIEDTVSLNHDLKNETDWREPISFFKERIDNASRFSKTEFGYQTDFFKMKVMETE